MRAQQLTEHGNRIHAGKNSRGDGKHQCWFTPLQG
jgi:hypothetical protein